MLHFNIIGLLLMGLMLLSSSVFGQKKNVSFEHKEKEQEVEVWINGKHFTSYLYHDKLKKPVLYPLKTVENKVISRGFPLDPKPGERVDHPHHLGHWFNYGDVNGIDFWNNSSARPADQRHKYGEIRTIGAPTMKAGKKKGQLGYKAHWVHPTGETLLLEETSFTFTEKGGTRIIDRKTTLTAKQQVDFTDNKEGMIAIRVTRALELPLRSRVGLQMLKEKPYPKKV